MSAMLSNSQCVIVRLIGSGDPRGELRDPTFTYTSFFLDQLTYLCLNKLVIISLDIVLPPL